MSAALIDALGGFAGVTIRVRHELPDASMRLLDTLGAHLEIDPSAPECVRFKKPFQSGIKPGGCRKCREIEQANA